MSVTLVSVGIREHVSLSSWHCCAISAAVLCSAMQLALWFGVANHSRFWI